MDVSPDANSVASAMDEVAYDTSKVVPPPLARKSPMAVARTTVADTYLKIVYGTPLKRGRIVFGALEPFGQVWRLGANETTELTVSGPVTFGGVDLDAGTYSLFAIPEPDKWTIIVNKGLGQWGAYDYDEALDVSRFERPMKSAVKTYEALTVWFDEPTESSTSVHFAWDQTEVTVPIRAR